MRRLYKLTFRREAVFVLKRRWWEFWKPHAICQLQHITVPDIPEDEAALLASSTPTNAAERLALRLIVQGAKAYDLRLEVQE